MRIIFFIKIDQTESEIINNRDEHTFQFWKEKLKIKQKQYETENTKNYKRIIKAEKESLKVIKIKYIFEKILITIKVVLHVYSEKKFSLRRWFVSNMNDPGHSPKLKIYNYEREFNKFIAVACRNEMQWQSTWKISKRVG